MWTVHIRNQTAHSVQSDLDLHCPQRFLVTSSVRKELRGKKKKMLVTSTISFAPPGLLRVLFLAIFNPLPDNPNVLRA